MTSPSRSLPNSAALAFAELPTLATPVLKACVLALVFVGVVVRLSPLLDIDNRLFWQFVTEDGYLMQTIARNMASGLGMTTAAGTIPTNGVQPLATLFFAALHWLAGTSKVGGIVLVMVFSVGVATAAAFLFYRVCRQVLVNVQHGAHLAMGIAALWFAAPQIVRHSMNGLETGIYYLAILAALDFYLLKTASGTAPFGWRERMGLGCILGLVFLARNDAVFFIAALLLAHFAIGGRSDGGGYHRRFVDCLTAGVVSMLVASPWLVYNYAMFGSIVPISGTAQSHDAALGRNAAWVPANVFEVAFIYAPIPNSLETKPLVMLAAAAAVVLVLVAAWRIVGRTSLAATRFSAIGALFGGCAMAYYGVWFGASWFLPRYFSPLAVFFWTATAVTGFYLAAALLRRPGAVLGLVGGCVAVLVVEATAFAVADFAKGRGHMHKQVVDWVRANVPDDQWVGAPQTGTVGFFHDRTINLDGKVNPEALRAKLREKHVFSYVLASKINYVADWYGVQAWVEDGRHPGFAKQFEVVHKDPNNNLAAMKRRVPTRSD